MTYANAQEFDIEFKKRIADPNIPFDEAWASMMQEAVDSGQDFFLDVKGEKFLDLVKADPDLAQQLADLPLEAKAEIDSAVQTNNGEVASLEVSSGLAFKRQMAAQILSTISPHPDIKEANGDSVMCSTEQFNNWGGTVSNQPIYTFIPKSKQGICNIVKWAKEYKDETGNPKPLKVRVSGYRHTWGELYAQDDHVLISSLNLDVVSSKPERTPPMDPDNELQGIKIVAKTLDGKQAFCKIGSATTNYHFLEWTKSTTTPDNDWALPLNVIMTEITLGGSNAPICHGAGRNNKTLSDLVTEIEFVNALGIIQTVSDPDLLKAAAGCFGMLGIVTSITFRLDAMSYANMLPLKTAAVLAVPTTSKTTVPPKLDINVTDQEIADAKADFMNRCENHYYSEWFWFPNRNNCWVNTWNNDGKEADSSDYPSDAGERIQRFETYMAQLMNQAILRHFPRLQANLLAASAMLFLPANKTIITSLSNALHFRRGIQNIGVLDFEFEFPIPSLSDGKPDWDICKDLWWIVIEDYYNRSNTPMRMTMEMRIMGGSDIIMAPQFGNNYTCSIEVLTPANVDHQEWMDYAQNILDAWTAVTDSAGKKLTNIRPHWAKQWAGLTMNGKPMIQYLKEDAYATQIPIFKMRLAAIAAAGGYKLSDCKERYSNPLLENLFEEIYKA